MTATDPEAPSSPTVRAPSDDLFTLIAELDAQLAVDDDEVLEVQSVRARHRAFDQLPKGPGRPDWPPEVPDLFPEQRGVVEITAEQLTPARLTSAVRHHGCLLVRGLLATDRVDQLIGDIDRSIEARDAAMAQPSDTSSNPWYTPFVPDPGYEGVDHVRRWVAKGGGTWLADSPRAFSHLVAAFHEIGLDRVLAAHLGERPVLSVKKSTLRRVPLTLGGADWHQDGAFMDRGAGIRTVNVWIALSDCGSDAPGLDLLPRRLDEILETGTNGAWFDWSVGEPTFEQLARTTPVLRPQFARGDALLFDEHLLHRTAVDPAMKHERYALETWFFAPSSYPDHLVPIVL